MKRCQVSGFRFQVLHPWWLVLLSAFIVPRSSSAQVPEGVNYQGRLLQGTNLVHGDVSLRLLLYTNAAGGTHVYEDTGTVTVVDGLYSTVIGDGTAVGSFPDVLTNSPLFMEVIVDAQILTPREQLGSVPYSLLTRGVRPGGVTTAMLADNAVTGVKIADGSISNTHLTTDAVDGSSVSDESLTGVDVSDGTISNADVAANTFWGTGGNAGTAAGTHLLGTTDDEPLELYVNGARALRLEPGGSPPNLIGGDANNTVAGGVSGATIGGGSVNIIGAELATIGGGSNNTVTGYASVVGGGRANVVQSTNSTVAGGVSNRILGIRSGESSIGGGRANLILNEDPTATFSTLQAVIGGGIENVIVSNVSSVIGGGCLNILYPGTSGTIAGGWDNIISNRSSWATIGGGSENRVGTNAAWATIAGGWRNRIHDSSQFAFIGGGDSNIAHRAALYAFLGGGKGNHIQDRAEYATIPGGRNIEIASFADWSAVGGGQNNRVAGNSYGSAIAGGLSNEIGTNAHSSAIGGGSGNSVSNNSPYGTIAGGANNQAVEAGATVGGGGVLRLTPAAFFFAGNAAVGSASTVAGGLGNRAVGDLATIPGGRANEANGDYAFAAGRRAKAVHDGAFVWSDSTDADFVSTAANQFLIRAAGGVGIGDTSPDALLDVAGDVRLDGTLNVLGGIVRGNPTAAGGERVLQMVSDGSLTFMIDEDNNSGSLDIFEWFEDGSTNGTSKLMELQANGDLRIRGVYSDSVAFDIAESFYMSEPLQPGEVVSIDPGQNNAVRRSSGQDDTSVLGIVSTKPGYILGGAPFDLDGLDVWGPRVRDAFLREESALGEQVLARDPDAHPSKLREQALMLFFEQHFAKIALAGRVPVRIDARFGAIEAGDQLVPSPVPGTAMKATRAGQTVIGTALERFDGGAGTVLTLVHRGTFSPPAPEADEMAELIEANRELRSRVEALESMVERLASHRPDRLAALTER